MFILSGTFLYNFSIPSPNVKEGLTMMKVLIKMQTEIRRLEKKNRELEIELEKLTKELDRLRQPPQASGDKNV